MADQDPATGAVDPRPEESNTGSLSGMAAVDVKTDAAGKALDADEPADEPAPDAAASGDLGTVDMSAAEGGEASPAEDPTKSLIEDHADGDKAAAAAITDVSSGMQSVANTSGMVEKSQTQSPEMRTGAEVAHDNAVGSLVKRFEKLCVEIGKEAAHEVTKELAKFHKIEDVVKDALKKAGVTG